MKIGRGTVWSWMGAGCLLWIGLGILACGGSDEGASGDYCGTLFGRLKQCGLRSEGRFSCTNYYDAAEPCETRCFSAATCSSLTPYICGGVSTADSVGGCLAECVGLKPVTCASGLKLSGFARCNGFAECGTDDDTDERDCVNAGRYHCRNVDQYVSYVLYCDGNKDCADGSDETPDCGAVQTCLAGGTMSDISAGDICNGFTTCDDGSDEPSDCSAVTCPNQ